MPSIDTDPVATSARRRTVAGYVVVGLAWVLFSDVVVNTIGGVGLVGQSLKGALFVFVTAAVLAALLRQRDERLAEQREARSLREEHLATTLGVVQDVVYRIELEPRRYSYVSPAIESLLGITPEEVLSDPAAADRFIHPDDRQRRAETSGDGVIRLRWRHRDGRTIWTEQRNRVEQRHGVPVAIIGVARDITGEVLGATVQEACSQLERGVLDGAGADETLPGLAATVRTAIEARRLRITIVGIPDRTLDVEVVDGAPAGEITLSVTAGPVRIEVAPSGYTPPVAVLTPLLERLATRVHHAAHHEARRRELERVEVALRATGIAILLLDDDGRITWSNAAAVTLGGYAHEELRNETLAVFVPGSDAELHAASVARVRAGGRYETEIELSRKDGNVLLATVAVAPVHDDDGVLAGAVASILDLTEERRASDALHAAQLAVLGRQRDLERERTVLVQTLSHELRTPLTVVLGAAQTLQRDAIPDVARARLTRSLERGTDDLLRHLDAVLAATDGLAGEVVATTGRAIVGMALERLGSRHDLDRVTIDGDASWTGPATEAAGLLRPLLHNALKFSPADARVEVTIADADSAPPGAACMVIVVADHGPGMPQAILPIMAAPFRQADSSVTRLHGGLGLGLHAARRSADRLGARLATSSGPNGTRVRVELPFGAAGHPPLG